MKDTSIKNLKPTKPTSAVALRYDGDSAPRVIAKGNGYIGEEIIRLAQTHDISIQAHPELVQILTEVNLGDEIPSELYTAVAEILAFTYALSGKQLDDGDSQ